MSAKGLIRTLLWGTVGAATAALLVPGGAAAQGARTRPQIITPPSGIERPEDIGMRAHTNVERVVLPGGLADSAVSPEVGPPFSGVLAETPASLACAYLLVTPASGCNPYVFHTNPTGGSHAIAIVDAFDYSTAEADLSTFDAQFGVAAANFVVI